MSDKKYFFLGGSPRSGSTLLLSILGQNPEIYTSGSSVVCRVLWANKEVFESEISQIEMLSQNKKSYEGLVMKSIIDLYYKSTEKKNVIDKNRMWTLLGNKTMIEKYIEKNPKIIVLKRKSEDVLKSYIKLFQNDGRKESISEISEKFLQKEYDSSDDFFRSYAGIMSAYLSNENNNYLFIDYKDIVTDIDMTLKNIYSFLNIKEYSHNLTNIEKPFLEDDSFWGIKNIHAIRKNISLEENKIILPTFAVNACKQIDKMVEYSQKKINVEEVFSFMQEHLLNN